MILKFPDLDTLRLALSSAAVPSAVAQSAAVAGFDDEGRVWIETDASLPRGATTALKRLGVEVARRSGAKLKAEVFCWAELLPLVADPRPHERPEQAAVLFELASGEQLAELAAEMLRLGNDRQGFRWLEPAGGNGEAQARALLRVVGPPYYSLLRAIDRKGPDAPRAYLERLPRVWVEIGYTHPLVAAIRPPEQKLLLLRPPRQWTLIDDAPFQDVYAAIEFHLPAGPVRWAEGALPARLKVTPSLRPGGSTEQPELWVLHDDPVAELNRFVQNAREDDLQRLAFAVGTLDDRTTIVLRARPSKHGPPALDGLPAEAYRSYAKLPNLFLPTGTTLHPPLRRDKVRELFAQDLARVTWLAPAGERGAFVPQSLPDGAFRPLGEWVEYVLDHDRAELTAWVESAQFEFEGFVCSEDPPPRPKKPPTERERREAPAAPARSEVAAPPTDEVPFAGLADDLPVALQEVAAEAPEPSALEVRLRDLEEQFLAVEGPLDAPERQQLWPALAETNARLDRREEASACWLHALWVDAEPPAETAWRLFQSEAAAARRHHAATGAVGRSWAARAAEATRPREVPADDLDRLLATPEPATADLRALAAYVVWAAGRTPPPAALAERLEPAHRFLERHEHLLPVRAAWLAWYHLARMAGNDALTLARARDRLLERLYQSGLRPEQDLPAFLRGGGTTPGARFRASAEWVVGLCEKARAWTAAMASHKAQRTEGYVDLLFAFALARLKEPDAARRLLHRGRGVLARPGPPVHAVLLKAFEYRIARALEGQPHAGPLPAEVLEAARKLDGQLPYFVDRLRGDSRVLEPDQKLDPYRLNWANKDNPETALEAQLPDLHDPQQIAERVARAWAELPRGKGQAELRARVLRVVLGQLPRLGEAVSRPYLDQAAPVFDALPEEDRTLDFVRVALLERALVVAAHYDLADALAPLLERFRRLTAAPRGATEVEGFSAAASACLRGLRRLGMRPEIESLLAAMAARCLGGRPLSALTGRDLAAHPADLQTLLHMAGAWFYFGRHDQAEAVLRLAREALVYLCSVEEMERSRRDVAVPLVYPKMQKTKLACAYVAALGQAPRDLAVARLEECFALVKGLDDNWTGIEYYNRLVLRVVEAVVWAISGDEFALGGDARRWLDEDEYLVRRRVHADLKALQAHV